MGYLEDGVAGWIKGGFELDYIPQITVQDFVELRNQEPDRITVLDVRELGELSRRSHREIGVHPARKAEIES